MSNGPKRDLLLFFLSSRSLEEKDELAKTLDREEWVNLAQEANRFDLMPLLYFRLGKRNMKMIPEIICQEFEKRWFVSTSANMLVYRQLSSILNELSRMGVPVIVLKGAYLAHHIYSDPALRPMGDVDLFVPRDQLEKTTEALFKMGYQTSRPFWLDDECAVRHHLPAFTQPGQPVVEIHWSLIAPTLKVKLDLGGLWKRAQPLVIAGIPAYVLDPVDLLAHLCLHTCRDRFVFGLRALCDVQECLQHFGSSFDWEELDHRAKDWKIERCIYLTLYLAARYLNAPVPEDFLASLRPDDFSPEVAGWAMGQMFDGRGLGTPLALAQVPGQKPIWKKLKAIFQGFFPAPITIRQKYALAPDSGHVYWYYMLHGFDLLRMHGWNALQLIRGNPAMLHPIQRMNALGEWLFP